MEFSVSVPQLRINGTELISARICWSLNLLIQRWRIKLSWTDVKEEKEECCLIYFHWALFYMLISHWSNVFIKKSNLREFLWCYLWTLSCQISAKLKQREKNLRKRFFGCLFFTEQKQWPLSVPLSVPRSCSCRSPPMDLDFYKTISFKTSYCNCSNGEP